LLAGKKFSVEANLRRKVFENNLPHFKTTQARLFAFLLYFSLLLFPATVVERNLKAESEGENKIYGISPAIDFRIRWK
jgi:hypothetical protein